ncbi:ArsR family transcriptional regulator [Candidatus Gracilibacteria bacterium]|nr:ArsR family transcriptional regulator [Candidatus Gracilibacteria bacterium]
MNQQKQDLISQTSELYTMIGYPPIAGKIIALFYISDEKYLTFEEIMETLKISKSATSKALKFLTDLGEVSFMTKTENSRKRYFYISVKNSLKSLTDWKDSLDMRKNILEKALKLRTQKNPDFNTFIQQQIHFIEDISGYIDQKIQQHFIS